MKKERIFFIFWNSFRSGENRKQNLFATPKNTYSPSHTHTPTNRIHTIYFYLLFPPSSPAPFATLTLLSPSFLPSLSHLRFTSRISCHWFSLCCAIEAQRMSRRNRFSPALRPTHGGLWAAGRGSKIVCACEFVRDRVSMWDRVLELSNTTHTHTHTHTSYLVAPACFSAFISFPIRELTRYAHWQR